jgi:hypothetical protein
VGSRWLGRARPAAAAAMTLFYGKCAREARGRSRTRGGCGVGRGGPPVNDSYSTPAATRRAQEEELLGTTRGPAGLAAARAHGFWMHSETRRRRSALRTRGTCAAHCWCDQREADRAQRALGQAHAGRQRQIGAREAARLPCCPST